jgi:hypothetical protein
MENRLGWQVTGYPKPVSEAHSSPAGFSVKPHFVTILERIPRANTEVDDRPARLSSPLDALRQYMKHKAPIALLLVIAALSIVIVRQWATNSDLEDRLEAATAELKRRPANAPARGSRPAPVLAAPTVTSGRNPDSSAPEAGSASLPGDSARERIERGKAARDERRAALQKQLDESRKAQAANPPAALTAERKQALLQGREYFNPGPVEESAVPVHENTPLKPGQALQVNYGNSWYAGEVVGFESDGGIHVRYFGWGPSWDEIVPRSDLRLDEHAWERAVDKYAASAGNGRTVSP